MKEDAKDVQSIMHGENNKCINNFSWNSWSHFLEILRRYWNNINDWSHEKNDDGV